MAPTLVSATYLSLHLSSPHCSRKGHFRRVSTIARARIIPVSLRSTVWGFKGSSFSSSSSLGLRHFPMYLLDNSIGLSGLKRMVIHGAPQNSLTGDSSEGEGERSGVAPSASKETLDPGEDGDRTIQEVIDVSNEYREGTSESLADKYQMFKEDLEIKREKFWSNFRDQHLEYKKDREQWGVGFKTIFTVHEDAEGNVSRVDVDEDEVLLRSGVDPLFPQFASEECKVLAQERIVRAKAHARDIESGLVLPSSLSVLYKYLREGQSTSASGTAPSVAYSSDSGSVPSPWGSLNLITLFIPVFLVGFAAKWFLSRKQEAADPVVAERNLRMMQMRKLRAQMNKDSFEEAHKDSPRDVSRDIPPSNSASAMAAEEKEEPRIPEGAQPRVDNEEFQRKVVEIQAMARQARLQEQERKEVPSPQSFKREMPPMQQLKKMELTEVQGVENSAKLLDHIRDFGTDTSDGETDLISSEPEYNAAMIPNVKKVQTYPSQNPVSTSDDGPGKQPGETGSSTEPPVPLPRAKANSPGVPPTAGVKPRIILSAEEARATINAKRSKISSTSPEVGKPKLENSDNDMRESKTASTENPTARNPSELKGVETAGTLSTHGSPQVSSGGRLEPAKSTPPVADHKTSLVDDPLLLEKAQEAVINEIESKCVDQAKQAAERTKDSDSEESEGSGANAPPKLKDEEEEMEWMRDEVLRDIVFKVQANEEAGREPFHELNSEQETLFFKGLERKFEREGEKVKKWIKDRVENIDYGSDGISIYDPPESYQLRWKDGADIPRNSDISNKFRADRLRILNEQRGVSFTSSPESGESVRSPDSEESVRSPKSTPSSGPVPLSPTPSETTLPVSQEGTGVRDRSSNGGAPNSGKAKTFVVSSSRSSETASSPSSTGRDAGKDRDSSKENWQNTKRWAKDLERKYELEKDPGTRSLMREIGQDLDRWITEDEIEQADRLLDKGAEGEEEYVKMHYEKTKEKIKKQQEMFGREAMVSKYSEYKPEDEEIELWWLDLPFLLCIGLRATIAGEVQTGLYSVDVSAAMEGSPSNPSDRRCHTVAFQDRGDAQNFFTLLSSQPERVGAQQAQIVPFSPQELYQDAKAEGFKVTVIKKGQLQLSIDQSFEEVESRIMEIGSARYYDDLLRDRTIDMDSVVNEALGYGQRPEF